MLRQASSIPVTESWEFFLQNLWDIRGVLRDGDNAILNKIYGIPISIWSQSPTDFFPVAQLIMGLGLGDEEASEEIASRISKRFAWQAFKSNAPPMLSLKDTDDRRTTSMHSLPYLVGRVFNQMRTASDAIERLRREDVMLFQKIPTELQEFRYPVELFEEAVNAALSSGSRNFPGAGSIEKEVAERGIDVNSVLLISRMVSEPAALHRIQDEGKVIVGIEPLAVSGSTIKLEGVLIREIRLLIAAIAGLLREAIYHSEMYRLKEPDQSVGPVEVLLASTPHDSILIRNPCVFDELPRTFEHGSQASQIRLFNRAFQSWRISGVSVNERVWERSIQRI
jgi:hypothetical protein